MMTQQIHFIRVEFVLQEGMSLQLLVVNESR